MSCEPVRRLSYLKVIGDAGYAELSLVKDIPGGIYYVEKSLKVAIDFQVRLFENEIKVHSMLDNRYIIRFVEQTGDLKFLMEYAAGGSLEKTITSDADDTVRVKYCLQFLRGLLYLHRLGYVHNDIKPSNILLTRENRAKLSDFAFTGKVGEVSFTDAPNFFKLGTDYFRNPRMENIRPVNRLENDIYSIGVVLYLLFSRRCAGKPIHIDAVKQPALKSIIGRCIEGEFKSVEAVIDDLEGVR